MNERREPSYISALCADNCVRVFFLCYEIGLSLGHSARLIGLSAVNQGIIAIFLALFFPFSVPHILLNMHAAEMGWEKYPPVNRAENKGSVQFL